MDGYLICLNVAVLPVLAADPYAGDGSAILLQEERDREGRNRTWIEERLGKEDVSWDMAAVVGDLLVKSNKPIVAVPEGARGFSAAGRAPGGLGWISGQLCRAASGCIDPPVISPPSRHGARLARTERPTSSPPSLAGSVRNATAGCRRLARRGYGLS
ncbi:hypothetical protein [Sphingobium aromaticiconvertens]|uniref:hypothetical protein n=1 Tax=Sphingobium aromaticiconvertens TaxID=365341 RepID=UPI003019D8C4